MWSDHTKNCSWRKKKSKETIFSLFINEQIPFQLLLFELSSPSKNRTEKNLLLHKTNSTNKHLQLGCQIIKPISTWKEGSLSILLLSLSSYQIYRKSFSSLESIFLAHLIC